MKSEEENINKILEPDDIEQFKEKLIQHPELITRRVEFLMQEIFKKGRTEFFAHLLSKEELPSKVTIDSGITLSTLIANKEWPKRKEFVEILLNHISVKACKDKIYPTDYLTPLYMTINLSEYDLFEKILNYPALQSRLWEFNPKYPNLNTCELALAFAENNKNPEYRSCLLKHFNKIIQGSGIIPIPGQLSNYIKSKNLLSSNTGKSTPASDITNINELKTQPTPEQGLDNLNSTPNIQSKEKDFAKIAEILDMEQFEAELNKHPGLLLGKDAECLLREVFHKENSQLFDHLLNKGLDPNTSYDKRSILSHLTKSLNKESTSIFIDIFLKYVGPRTDKIGFSFSENYHPLIELIVLEDYDSFKKILDCQNKELHLALLDQKTLEHILGFANNTEDTRYKEDLINHISQLEMQPNPEQLADNSKLDNEPDPQQGADNSKPDNETRIDIDSTTPASDKTNGSKIFIVRWVDKFVSWVKGKIEKFCNFFTGNSDKNSIKKPGSTPNNQQNPSPTPTPNPPKPINGVSQ